MSNSDLSQPLVTATAYSSQKAAPAPKPSVAPKELSEEEQTHKLLPEALRARRHLSPLLSQIRSLHPGQHCALCLYSTVPSARTPPSHLCAGQLSVPGLRLRPSPRSPSRPLPHSWVSFPLQLTPWRTCSRQLW